MMHEAVTLHEIHAQPEVWRRCLDSLSSINMEALAGDKNPGSYPWVFVGCGTSYYLAQAAAATFTLLGVAASAVPASEVLLFPELALPSKGRFPVLISRSGHTSEVLRTAELLKQRKIEFLAVTCDCNELAGLTPRVLKLPVEEQSIVMTSSFTSMLMALQYVGATLTKQAWVPDALRRLPDALALLLPRYEPQLEQLAQNCFRDVAFLGQGALYPIASETALKVMESSSTYAQFFPTLEFRHGPKSIVSKDVLVGALLSESGYAEESAVLLEMKELGAHTIAIANHLSSEVKNSADVAIELSLPVPELARLIVYVVWGQLFGSYLGLNKGMNPDSPRHLSRVVTIG